MRLGLKSYRAQYHPAEHRHPRALWQVLRRKVPGVLRGIRTTTIRSQKPWYMIDPSSRWKSRWDLLLIVCVIYISCLVPYRVCFSQEAAGGFAIVEGAIDISFALDIMINFITGVQLSGGDLSYDHRVITRSYLRGWFVVDLLSTLPVEGIAALAGMSENANPLSTMVFRTLKAIRLVKLTRIRRLGKVFSSLEDAVYINQSVVSLVRLALTMLFIAHLVACIWFGVAMSEEGESWIKKYEFTDMSRANAQELQYIVSMYWAIVTMATIGYGDVVATTNIERLLNIFIMAIGVTFFGYIIGTISSLVANLNVSASLYDERMTIIKEYIISRQIPSLAAKRIRTHFEYYYQNRSVFKERQILKRLPTALRNEMIHHVHSKALPIIRYFTECHESLISDIVIELHPFEVMKDEYVFGQHEIAAHVFFLMKGKIKLIKVNPTTHEEMQVSSIGVGEHFGELEIYDEDHGNGVRVCSALAKSYSELNFLSRDAILRISNTWPELLVHFKKSAKQTASIMRRRIGPLMSISLTSTKSGRYIDLQKEQARQESVTIVTKTMLANNRPTSTHKNRIAPMPDVESKPAPDAERVGTNVMEQNLEYNDTCPINGMNMESLENIQEDDEMNGSEVDKKDYDGSSGSESDGDHGDEELTLKNDHSNRLLLAPIARSYKEETGHVNYDDSHRVQGVANDAATTPTHDNSKNESKADSEYQLQTLHPDMTLATRAISPPRASLKTSDASSVTTSAEDEKARLDKMLANIRHSTMNKSKANMHVERNLLKGTYLFHPHDSFIVWWQMLVGLAILYSIVMVPFRLGFDQDAVGPWLTMELCIDALFMMDIIIHFRTAYFDEEKNLKISRKAIFWRYVRGWFVLDLISTLPFDDIVRFFANGSEMTFFPTKLLRLVRIVRLLKLTRLMKLSRVFLRIREYVQVSPSTERLLRLLGMMYFFCHWSACIFHAVMLASETADLPSWCDDAFNHDPKNGTGNLIYCSSNISVTDRYIAAIYWAFTTLTTVGYGDIRPHMYSVYELSIVILLTVVHATVFGYVISSVVTLMRNLDPADREYRLLMTEMKDYMRDSSVNTRLCSNVKSHYKHNISCMSLFPEQKIFDKMCPSLRFDIARIVAAETLFQIPLITVMEDSFKGFVSYALFLFQPMCVSRAEKVCESESPGVEMFFVVEGECDVVNTSTGQGRVIRSNAVFEQYSLIASPGELYRTVCNGTAVSTKCILYSLSVKDFKMLQDVSPAMSSYFLSQVAAVLIEDELFPLNQTQTINAEIALRKGQAFRSIAEKHTKQTRMNSLGSVVRMAKNMSRRSSEWSPDLLPMQWNMLNVSGRRSIVAIQERKQVAITEAEARKAKEQEEAAAANESTSDRRRGSWMNERRGSLVEAATKFLHKT